MSKLEQFINENKVDMLADLQCLIIGLQREIKACPEDYIEPGTDDPSIDVRLCIDLGEHPGWIIRTGLSDYDPYFSEYCSASCVDLETTATELLEDLISGLDY